VKLGEGDLIELGLKLAEKHGYVLQPSESIRDHIGVYARRIPRAFVVARECIHRNSGGVSIHQSLLWAAEQADLPILLYVHEGNKLHRLHPQAIKNNVIFENVREKNVMVNFNLADTVKASALYG
jgi:hypothetical protein